MRLVWPILLPLSAISLGLSESVNDSKKCPDGWDFVAHNSHCYLFVNRPMPQNMAQKYCSLLSEHAHLARVRNRDQNDFLQEYAFFGEQIWLQAKAKFDIIDSRASLNSPGLVLRWKNGNPVLFSNWLEGNGFKHLSLKQLCVLMDRHGKWLNADCAQAEKFVCEVKSTAVLHYKHRNAISLLKCPTDWTFNVKTSACYRAFSKENMTWLDADKLCNEEGAKHNEEAVLASVHSYVENQFLTKLGAKCFPEFEFIMLGAIGHSSNADQWDWIDGSSFALFSNWENDRPSGSKKAAVLFMQANGKWLNWYADQRFKRRSALAVCKFLVS